MADPALEKERDAPNFKVLAGGGELPVETALDILEVQVSLYAEGASAFTITFNNWHSERQEFKLVDADTLKEGTEVEVRVGYVDSLASMIVGEVTALEPEFHVGEAPTLKVQGYDRLHRFRRGRRTRSFTNMKDSDIAAQIAGDLGLRSQADDTSVTHDYVLQSNQSDIDFLLARARRINFEVTVKDKTLNFRKAASDNSKVVSLEYGLTLKSFYPRLTTIGQVSEVVVQGWDFKTKEAIAGTARQGDQVSKMGQKLGVAIAEDAFKQSKAVVVDRPVFSEGEAAQIAKGKFNEMAADFINGEGVAIGNTALRAGEVVELLGLGRRFSGLYYVTAATHVVNHTGYTTRFNAARNAT
ncbi:MAG: contractile injection system protein, VgrG/Pvc8 family [Acidobacteriota bacterium]|nr:contractile injection system protein, VgrG/Pvc8 family [Acidobacteriota bacterium]